MPLRTRRTVLPAAPVIRSVNARQFDKAVERVDLGFLRPAVEAGNLSGQAQSVFRNMMARLRKELFDSAEPESDNEASSHEDRGELGDESSLSEDAPFAESARFPVFIEKAVKILQQGYEESSGRKFPGWALQELHDILASFFASPLDSAGPETRSPREASSMERLPSKEGRTYA